MPDWSKEIASLLSGSHLDPAREAEVAEELGQHLADRFEELLGRGLTEKDAYRAVIEELGDGKLAADLARALPPGRPPLTPGEGERSNLAAGPWRDLRHGARLLRRDPGFSMIAVLSLALGVGANTAIFQLLDVVRLRTLPVRDPENLGQVRVVQHPNGRTGAFTSRHPDLTRAIWERVRDEQKGFSGVAAWSSERVNLAPGGEARSAEALWVSGGFFELLGVKPLLGRLILPSDDRGRCDSPGVVVSGSFWQRELGGRASAIGSKISLERHPFEIIGVSPQGFFGVDVGRRFDVALPLCAEPILAPEKPRSRDPQAWWLAVIGRLRPGWSFEQASAQLAAISPAIFQGTVSPRYDATDRKNYFRFKLGALPAASGWSSLRGTYANPLTLLLAISALVLLIACANLANLMVARASAREREIAVRLALGASRGLLIRQLLAESLVLAVVGAACGAAVAQGLTRVLVSYLGTAQTPLFVDLRPDWRVLAFTAGLALVTCLVFGVLPAIQGTRTEPTEALKAGGRGLAGARAGFWARRALVVSQVSLSLVLLVGALLFVRTFRNLITLDAGFRQDRILVTEMDFSALRLPMEARVEYRRRLLERLRAIPAVGSAASARIVPASGYGWNESINIVGSSVERQLANFNRVSPGYFRTVGTPLLTGRDFGDGDTGSSPPAAIVTETFVRKYLPGSNPIGRTIRVPVHEGGREPRYEIVGLVKDAKYGTLREEFTPVIFLADAQEPEPELSTRILLRSDGSLADLVSSVKRAVAEVNPSIVIEFRVFRTMLREGVLRERLMATLAGFFGALAAVLAMIGLYGVISFMVVRRRNEIGVRIALGASRGNIVAMVMREAGALLGVGIAIGTLLALAAATTARGLLFGLNPSDPSTVAIAVAGLSIVALAASLLPARRAAALDPMQALREE